MTTEHSDESALMMAGIVGSPRGLQGEVSVLVRTDWPEERFYQGAELQTDNERFPQLTVTSVSEYKDRLYLKFAEIRTREDAESIKHAELLVNQLFEEDAWYAAELVGLRVVNENGEDLGTVTALQVGAAQDLLEIDASGQTVLVPLVEQLVPKIDVDGGVVTVNPPAGLFPEVKGD